MTKTYQQILDFITVTRTLRGTSKVPLSKFHYAIDKMTLRVRNACADFEKKHAEKIMDLKISLASVDADKNIIQDAGNYRYTRENMSKLESQTRELNKSKASEPFEIEPYVCVPPDLSMSEAEALKGFVIEENYEVIIPEIYERQLQ